MISGLDGLRAIAFLMVFLFHTDYLVFDFGWVGVQLFFVLSGFLITSILVKMKRNLPPREYFLKFYGRRFLRIFPLYYFYILLIVCVRIALTTSGYQVNKLEAFKTQILYALGYVYNFFFAGTTGGQFDSFLFHFWSLSVEEQFYIFWPLLIFLFNEKARKRLFLFVIAFAPAFRFLVLVGYKYSLLPFLNAKVSFAVYSLTFSHVDAFALGAFVACFSIPKPKTQLAVLTFLLPALAYVWQYLYAGEISSIPSLGYPFMMPLAYQFVWGYTALNYYFAVLIQAIVREGFGVKLLENRVLKHLGKISYGLYVYHVIAIWFTTNLHKIGLGEKLPRPTAMLAAFVITVVMSELSYKLLEAPLLKLKDRYFVVVNGS